VLGILDQRSSACAYWAIQCSDGRLEIECEDWPIVVQQTLAMSDIPVLVLSGEFDPPTLPEYVYSVSKGLTNSFVNFFPGLGHWVNGGDHPCRIEIIQSFLNDLNRELNRICSAPARHPLIPIGEVFTLIHPTPDSDASTLLLVQQSAALSAVTEDDVYTKTVRDYFPEG
jgi:hypothetical protein